MQQVDHYKKMSKAELIDHISVLRQQIYFMQMREAAFKEQNQVLKAQIKIAQEDIKRLSYLEKTSFGKDVSDLI